jgi:hypothetical protein
MRRNGMLRARWYVVVWAFTLAVGIGALSSVIAESNRQKQQDERDRIILIVTSPTQSVFYRNPLPTMVDGGKGARTVLSHYYSLGITEGKDAAIVVHRPGEKVTLENGDQTIHIFPANTRAGLLTEETPDSLHSITIY